MAALDTLDMGAPISCTRGSKLQALGMLRYNAGQVTSIHGDSIENSLPGEYVSFTLKEPVGVVGATIPWNGPLTATIWKIGPALATGCTVVLEPGEEAPLTALRLAELCHEAGVPPAVVNVVTGYGETAGAALSAHPDVDKVAFTGRTSRAEHYPGFGGQLEAGVARARGKSPDAVLADADLDAAVPGAAMAVFANSGQICSAGTRLFVEQTIFEEFTARVAAFSKTLRVGNSSDPETQVDGLSPGAKATLDTKSLRLVGGSTSPVVPAGQNSLSYFIDTTNQADVFLT